jgi:TolB-like protein/DNA-binding winged helix-turn-helix (wHTH) protein/Flp pilus assembly protein TadD
MHASVGSDGSYRFGLFEVDGPTGELRKQGRAVRLRGRPFDILLLLLNRRGDVITRDELRQRLWPADTFVDFDHGLNSAMNRLREALGDSAENPRFVETLPKRGYRFIAPIEVVDREVARHARTGIPSPESQEAAAPPAMPDLAHAIEPMASEPLRREAVVEPPTGAAVAVSTPSRIVLLAATGALVAAVVVALLFLRVGQNRPAHSAKMTLAVLPFENLSADADQDFFSDGFTEEMIAELGKLDPDRLGVIARTTTRLYKNARKNIGQIHQELGVDYVLEGSIRRAGNRMRITAQLVQTNDMTHLWAESYDRDVSDALAIQSEVAMKIAHSLTLALRRPDAGSARGTTSASAYDLYLRGRSFRDQATEESTRKAIEYFQRALAADPHYARAYAGIADAYWLLGAPGWEVEQPMGALQKAQASAERALAIDPQLAEARAVLAMVRLSYRWDRQGAEREIQEAIRVNPSSALSHQYYSTALTTMGRFDEAIAEARRALDLDPLSAPASTTLAIRYLYAGRLAESTTQFSKTVDANPEFAVAHWGLAQAHLAHGDGARALDELQRALELSGNSAYMRAHLAYGLAASGNRDRALSIQRELDNESRERYQSPYHQALIAVGLGDRERMMRALERALADRSGWMVFLPVQPEFARVRATPEFQRLLARVTPLP